MKIFQPQSGGGGGGSVNSVTASLPLTSSGGANPNIALNQPAADFVWYTDNAGILTGDNLFIRDSTSNYTDILKDFSVSEQGGFRVTPDVTGGNLATAVPGSFVVDEDTVTNLYAVNGAGDISGFMGIALGSLPTSTANGVYNSITGDNAVGFAYFNSGTSDMIVEANTINGTNGSGWFIGNSGFSAYADDNALNRGGNLNIGSTSGQIGFTDNATGFESGFFSGTTGSQMTIKPVFTATKDWTLSMIDDTVADSAILVYSNVTDNDRYFLLDPRNGDYQIGDISGAGNSTKIRIADTGASVQLDGSLLVQSNAVRTFINGSIQMVRTVVNNTDYTILDTDYLVSVIALSASRTITVPDASSSFAGRTYVIKDAGGLAATWNIVLDPVGTDTIDGAATMTMATNYQSVTLISDGVSNWEVI